MSVAEPPSRATASRISSLESQCAAEPIHAPGTVQPHGILLAADPENDLTLVAASANCAEMLDREPIGCGVSGLFGTEFLIQLAEQGRAGTLDPMAPWETKLSHPAGTGALDVTCHSHAGLVLIEAEPADAGDAERAGLAAGQLQRSIAELRANDGGLEELAGALVRCIRRITGYDRVLVYRFDHDWHGQAIAENRAEDGPASLFGLHFPASDIPSQARALYMKSLMRWVPSRDAVPVPLRLAPGWAGRTIDLSYARLRSLSPTHMQYHRNMGVDGTMSLSILNGRELWGLVVCHHRAPHRTTGGQRAAAAALTDAFALRIGPAGRANSEAARQKERRRFAALIAQMAQAEELGPALASGPVTMLDMFDATGAAVVQGESVLLLGTVPPGNDVLQLARWLRESAPPGQVFATASLPAQNPAWAPHAEIVSGLLAMFLDDHRDDVLMWFRPEEPTLVSWGGNPHKAAESSAAPRRSFERWVEERRGTSRRWVGFEIELAGLLRQAITDVILRNFRRVATLNERLRQSQRMEAVGQLTGGLAHDFNNLLGGITGSLELAQTRLGQGRTAEVSRFLTAALGAAGRAASLTHRLLAFSRRQTLDPRPIDAGKLMALIEALTGGISEPALQVEYVAAESLWTVLCDASQLETVLLSLALNGRDAMPDGGRLMIDARNAEVDEALAEAFDLLPGGYVIVSVSDTGQGMPRHVAARAFEPFFTTKPLGLGTGLGLSMAYGFAKQSGGHACIASEQGVGTTVQIYLPRHMDADNAQPDILSAPARAATSGNDAATILVVDDEDMLRMLICEVLNEHGYKSLEASDGSQALASLKSSVAIDLMLSDVGLPGGMNGRQVAEAARQLRPDLRVLFITGYADKSAMDGGLLNAVTQVLTKPFSMNALIEKIRAMLP